MSHSSHHDHGGGEQEEGAVASAPVQWGLAKRISFRFVCAYFFLYIFPFPLRYIPLVDVAEQQYQTLWQSIVTWVGKQVFGGDITVFGGDAGRPEDPCQAAAEGSPVRPRQETGTTGSEDESGI